MKKIYIVAAVVALALIALPFIGNQLAKDAIENQLTLLKQNGVSISESSEESGFFSSSNHYEFVVSEGEKFALYLSEYADQQIPPYVNALLQGVKVGSDIHYNNLPFSNTLKVDLYLLSFPQAMNKELKNEDMHLFEKLDTFLQSKGLLYHINYNLLTSSFDGYVKDIDQTLEIDDKKLSIKLDSLLFDGMGSLIAPSELQASAKSMNFKIFDDANEASFVIEGIESSSTFSSDTSYISSASMDALKFVLQERNKPVGKVNLEELKFNISSNMENEKAEAYVKSSFEKLSATMNGIDAIVNGFNYDISVTDLDKDALQELRVLLSKAQANSSRQLQNEIEATVVRLIAQGLKIEIADFSIDTFTLEGNKEIEGFSVQSELTLAANPAFTNMANAMQLIEDITVLSNLKISKDFFEYLNTQMPVAAAMSYANDTGDNLEFKVEFKDGKLTINDKTL